MVEAGHPSPMHLRLHLMRHAKSSWEIPGQVDRDRGLNPRGLRDAPRMGAALAERIPPLPVVFSPAQRARATLEGLCEGWPQLAALEHSVAEALYTFDSDDLMRYLREQVSEDRQQQFLIGHNPAFTELVNRLVGREVLPNLPTAGYAVLDLAAERWADVSEGCADGVTFLLPRELR